MVLFYTRMIKLDLKIHYTGYHQQFKSLRIIDTEVS